MTATNHMLAGAAIAVGLQNPVLVLPIALVSHFLLDALPHFGVHADDPLLRNKHPLFQYVLAVDIIIAATLLVFLPIVLAEAVAWWVLLLGMVVAWIPDLVWSYHFFHQVREQRVRKHDKLSHLHKRIQWYEKPWGLATEVVWLCAMGLLLGTLVAA